MTYFIGLDFGTSGARACVIDDDRAIVWEQRIAYPEPDSLRADAVHTQSPSDWRVALHTLLSALPGNIASEIQGLSIDGTSGTVLLCDETLQPCSPVLLYNDQRAQQEATRLKIIAPEGHTVCTATSGLAKFLWLTAPRPSAAAMPGGTLSTETHPNHLEHAAYFLHQTDWLTSLLSGQPGISDYHNALKTGYDVENLRWPDWVMALPYSHLLPEVLAPGQIIGNIQPDIAAHFGINPRCAIHAGTTDSNAAFMATGVCETGVGVTSLGSTLVLKQLSPRRIESAEYGVYSHRYGELWLVSGASNAGAGVLRHYFTDAQLAALSAQINPLLDSPLDYYPLGKPGERFPISNANYPPRLEPRPASDVEFLHGLLQGLARIETAGYAKLSELGASALIRVISNGGGAKNEVWRNIRERLLGVPVGTAPQCEAAYGSALLSLNGLTLSRNINSN